MNQYSYGAFVMMSVVPFGTPGVAIHFDATMSESWSVSQDVPSYAVAQSQTHTQVVKGNTAFRADLAVSETPLELVPKLVPWPTPDETQPTETLESYRIYPDTIVGEARVNAVWRALQDNLSTRWDLHTTRHGFLGSMVITSLEMGMDSPRREARIRLTFQRFEVANIATIKVQRQIRAKKAAAKTTGAAEWTCLEEPPWYLQPDGQTLQAAPSEDRRTMLRARLDAAKEIINGRFER